MPPKGKSKSESAAPPAEGFSLISNGKLIEIYATMLKCRMLAERAPSLVPQSAANPRLAPGQEAALVGVIADLQPKDTVAPSPREFLTSFAKGASLKSVLASLHKTARLLSRSSAPSLADQLNTTIAAAKVHKARKSGRVAAAFIEASALRPALRNALKLARAQDLAILFVCLDSPQPASGKPPARDLLAEAKSIRVPSMAVDGNDVVAVFRVAHEAIVRARLGRGPTLIECKSNLVPSASKSAPAKRRGSKPSQPSAADPILQDDPIHKMEAYLTRKGLFTAATRQSIIDAFNADLAAAIPPASKSPARKTA